MDNRKQPTEVRLIGSSPCASAQEFFTTTARALGKRLHSVPDGETDFRNNFIAWQYLVFPITIVRPQWGGQPSADSSAQKYTLQDINPTGYDDQAIASYATFCELRAAGTIPPNVRFQVSLPSPLNVVRGLVEDDTVCAQVDPLYEERLLQTLHRIQDSIPASDLTIQWDLAVELAVLEYERGNIQDHYWKPYFSPVKEHVFDQLIRLAGAVKPSVEMGYHLCYGDMGHKHFVQPPDAELLVEMANAIVQKIGRVHSVAYIHMPVPKDRLDEAYFKPLKTLDLQDTKLILGLVHAHDEAASKKRLETAQTIYPNISGVSTECGLGRTPPEELDSILEICASLTA